MYTSDIKICLGEESYAKRDQKINILKEELAMNLTILFLGYSK